MPEIDAIERQELTIPVNVLGNVLLVTYRPFGITMDMSIQQLASQQQANMHGLYDAFCATVTGWDLYEAGGMGMVHITPQRLSTLPGTLVMLVLEACMDDKNERQANINAGKAPGRLDIPMDLADRMSDYLGDMSILDQRAAEIVNELRDIMEA